MTSINCLVSDHQLQHICPLQIQKELLQALTRRRSCNTMAKQKRTKGQTVVDKTLQNAGDFTTRRSPWVSCGMLGNSVQFQLH